MGFIYLRPVVNNGQLTPDAGQRLVQYEFNLTKTGPEGTHFYQDAYEIHCNVKDGRYECDDPEPKNPEDTWFKSAYYERHWAQNWFDTNKFYFCSQKILPCKTNIAVRRL